MLTAIRSCTQKRGPVLYDRTSPLPPTLAGRQNHQFLDFRSLPCQIQIRISAKVNPESKNRVFGLPVRIGDPTGGQHGSGRARIGSHIP